MNFEIDTNNMTIDDITFTKDMLDKLLEIRKEKEKAAVQKISKEEALANRGPISVNDCPVLDPNTSLPPAAKILNLQHHVNCRFDNIKQQIEALRKTLELAGYYYQDLYDAANELGVAQSAFLDQSRNRLKEANGV